MATRLFLNPELAQAATDLAGVTPAGLDYIFLTISASAMAGRTHRSRRIARAQRFDLVVCYDVLQYLTDAEAARAIANLGRLCRGALFLHAPTREDWQRNADRSCSDEDIHLRPTDWYRTRLARRFRHAGFGLYVRRNVPLVQWELARAEQ